MIAASHPHLGPSLEAMLADDGTPAEAHAIAIERILAWQVGRIMAAERPSKSETARGMKTSRSALDRLPDPDNPAATLLTMDEAAAVPGERLRVELVDEVA